MVLPVVFLLLALLLDCAVSADTTNANIMATLATANSQSCRDVTVSEADVLSYLLKDYSNQSRPRKNASEAVNVTIAFRLSGITDFYESQNLLILNGYLTLGWRDDFLIWNDTWPLSCVNNLYVNSELLWLPDAALTNSRENPYSVVTAPRRIAVKSDGSMYHAPNTQFSVFCDMNHYYFPVDTQICKLSFRNWNIPSNLQHLVLYEASPFKIVDWVESHIWELTGSSAKAIIIPKWEEIVFTFAFSRRPLFYYVNFFVPSILISFIVMSTFAIQFDDPMRLHISVSCLLAYSVFQTTVVAELPRSSNSNPLLCTYIILQSTYISVAIMSEAYVLYLTDKRHLKMSACSWKLVRFLGGILCVHYDEKNDRKLANAHVLSNHQPNKVGTESSSGRRFNVDQPHWTYTALVIDRLSLGFYLLATIITPTLLILVLPCFKPEAEV